MARRRTTEKMFELFLEVDSSNPDSSFQCCGKVSQNIACLQSVYQPNFEPMSNSDTRKNSDARTESTYNVLYSRVEN